VIFVFKEVLDGVRFLAEHFTPHQLLSELADTVVACSRLPRPFTRFVVERNQEFPTARRGPS
jgi:hypothetical protein